MELNSPSRFGGLVPIEDTYHIGIVGPFKKWDAVAKSEYMFTRMKGRSAVLSFVVLGLVFRLF